MYQDLCRNLWYYPKKSLWEEYSTLGYVVPLAMFVLANGDEDLKVLFFAKSGRIQGLSVSFKLTGRVEIANWLKCESNQGPAPRITNPKSLLSFFCLSNGDEDVWVLLFLLPKVEEWFILSMTSWLCSAPHLRQDRWRKLEGLSAREWKILLFLSKGNSILQKQCTKEIKRLAFMLIRINTEIWFVRFQLFLFTAFFYRHFEFSIFNSFTLNIRSKDYTFILSCKSLLPYKNQI